MRWDLIGRVDELQTAATALAERRTLVVAGATGVGKTRLLDELVAADDRPVFRAVATAATATVPLSPFVALAPSAPTQDLSVLVHHLLGALRSRGGADGLLVVIDDAHHLDDASLALLAVLDDEQEIALALTIGTERPLADGLRAVVDRDRVTRLDLEPLGADDAAALVVAAIGPTAPAVLEDIAKLAGGNPLIVRELLAGAGDRLVVDAEGRRTVDGHLGSARLRELVRDRLDHLDEDVRRSLELVSVASPLPYDLLSAVIGPDALTALHDADVVETVTSGDVLLVRPTHPLYGELYAVAAGETRRRDAFRRLVAGAAELPGGADPLRIALWHDGTGDQPDAAIRHHGARAALGRHDGALAEHLLRPVADDLRTATELATLGMALVQQGRALEASERFSSAAHHAETPDEITEVASARAFNLAFGLGQPADAISVLVEARDAVDGVRRSRLDAERGVIAAIDGDFVLALSAAVATIDNPEAAGPALASAYVSSTLAEAMLGRCDDIEATSARGVEIAQRCAAELPFARDQILIMAVNALVGAGRIDEADAMAAEVLAEPGTGPATATPWLGSRSIALLHAGRLQDAATFAREAVAAAGELDPFRLLPQVRGILALVRGLQGHRGERSELEELRQTNHEPRTAVWLDRARTWERATAGELGAAADIALAGGRAAIEGQHVMWGMMALHDAARLGQPEEVADLLGAAAATTVGADLLEAMADHARALLERSAGGLGDVADRFASQGAWLLAAEAGAQQCGIHEAAGADGAAGRAAAISMLREARCQAPVTPALLRRPSIVSPRALEIAADAAAGTPSAEIGERQFISVRTVDNHLGRLYRTLGVGGRDELAAVLGPHLTGR